MMFLEATREFLKKVTSFELLKGKEKDSNHHVRGPTRILRNFTYPVSDAQWPWEKKASFFGWLSSKESEPFPPTQETHGRH